MPKMKVVRLQQELVEEIEKEVKKSQYPNLSEFVSEAIRLRLQTLTKQRTSNSGYPITLKANSKE